jgi:RNA polymerase sigma-70 factor (ECF subfamily)
VSWDSEKESALVKAAQQDDRAAYRQLYDHYLPLIYARVCALVPLSDAEDVTQEIFLSVARSIHGFRSRSTLSTWMGSIVGRRVVDYYRRAARQVPQVPLADDCDVPAEANPGSLEDELVVKQVLYSLPEHQREVILLRLVEELPFREVASRLGIKVGAAKVRFYRAIAACRQKLAETGSQDVTSSARRTTNEVGNND